MNAKYYPLIKLGRQASLMKRRLTQPIKLFTSGFLNSESYYPELPRKSKLRMVMDQLGHILKYGNIERYYFAYGLDIKGFRDRDDYLDDGWFLWKCSMLNTVLTDHDYTCILRDKELFATVLAQWGYESPHSVACIRTVQEAENTVRELFTKEGNYFCKPVDGECGGGALELIVSLDFAIINGTTLPLKEAQSIITGMVSERPYIIQTLVKQHPDLNHIYDKSINTLRLITVFDKRNNQAVPLSAVLRVGANGNVVDNWAKGGLAIGVDLSKGTLNKFAFYKQGKGTKVTIHPDSKIPFEGLAIPFFHSALRCALDLHQRLASVAVIGWDIAITSHGPIFIEGNDNMEISINQEANGGLKEAFLKLIQ